MRVFRRLTIRSRITIGTLVIAAIVAFAAVVTFRAQVDHIQNTTTTTLLHHDASPYVTRIMSSATPLIDKPGRGQLVAVITPSGIIAVSNLPKRLEGKLDSLARLDDDTHTITMADEEYAVYNETVSTTAGTWHVITARNQDSSIIALDQITHALMVGAVLGVIGFGLTSWILTALALRPVTRMRRQAKAILAEGSTEPLPVGPAMDELSALAVTLNEFIADVRQSVDRERQLVSDASHELRTPLAILMGQLELAHLSSGDAVALEAEITDAQRSVQRLSGLATGLLELSQLEQPAAAGGVTTSDWNQLAGELAASVDRARLAAAATGVTIDYDIDQVPTEARYRVAPTNFGRVILNLANNAATAVPDGGWVRIALRHSPVGLALTVVDSGPGMPEEFIPVAFDRFSRADESRAKNSGGSGLGLAIVHAIVDAAGGSISLVNANGLSVTVTMPAV